MNILRVPCFFDTVLGIYCPGCGGTRALMALLSGHFLTALWYHPLVPYFSVVCGVLLLAQGLRRLQMPGARKTRRVFSWRFPNWYLWAGLAILAANWAAKNILRLWFGILM